jgi:hypothetical protein
MMTALVFGITGVAVLSLGGLTTTESQSVIHDIKRQYAVESNVNTALWRVNTFDDSLATFIDGPVAVNFDTSTQTMTVAVSMYNKVNVVQAELAQANHFSYSIATSDSLELYDYEVGHSDQHPLRGEFRFLPQPDMNFFMSNAVEIHTGDHLWIRDWDLADEGIHVFTGDDIWFESVELHNSTIVFTGNYVYFYKDNDIRAPEPEEGVAPLPALVFTNPDIIFSINREWYRQDRIEGAIYCAGKINLKYGEISGPIISRKLSVRRSITLTDSEHPEFYTWTQGFGSYYSYDWPEHIVNWQQYAL